MRKGKLYSRIMFLAGVGTALILKKSKKNQNKVTDKYSEYYSLLNKWMEQKKKGMSIAEKLQQRGIQEVAIYGMGDIAKHLQQELAGTGVIVKYAIDRSVRSVIEIDTYLPNSKLPPVDAVIVTPFLEYDTIYSYLRKKVSCQIICITELIDGIRGCGHESR